MNLENHQRWFFVGCVVELGLLVIAVGLGWLVGHPFLTGLRWDLRDALIGLLASVPLFGVFVWLLGSDLRWLVEIRQFLDEFLRPIFGQWSLAQIALISLFAGIGEEILFRGVIQGALESSGGPLPAIIVASLLFGLFHTITPAYALIATLIGIYLGAFKLMTNNLLTPIIIHSLYDFVALVYFLKAYRGGSSDVERPNRS